jgi:hypothetical protein
LAYLETCMPNITIKRGFRKEDGKCEMDDGDK